MIYNVVLFADSLWIPRLRPYGAFAIASRLRSQGYSVLVIDHLTKLSQEQRLSFIQSFVGPETLFVGYSSTLFLSMKLQAHIKFLPIEKEEFVELNERVRELGSKVVFGGALAHSMFKYAVDTGDCLGVDYVMSGYSETMILDLASKLKAKTPVLGSKFNKRLQYIDYADKGEGYDFNSSVPEWAPEDFVAHGESLPLETARGCVFKCKFCAYTLLGKNKNDDTYIKSEESLFRELSSNYEKWGTTTYTLVDDTFNERTDKIERLLRVRDRLKVDLTFVGFNRLDMIARKPEQLGLLKALGFRGFFFGIESFHEPSARSIGKGMPSQEAEDWLYKIRDAYEGKVSITGSFILGLPHETPKTAEVWINKIVKQDFPLQHILLTRLHFTDFSSTKSEFHLNAEKYGYTITGDNAWRSDVWTSESCQRQVENINRLLQSTGRQKLHVFTLPSFMTHGHTFESLIHVSVNNAIRRLGDKPQKHLDTYVQNLLSLRSI